MNSFLALFDKKITINISVRTTVFLLLVSYFLWELYWSVHVGLAFIKWHTHLMVYVYLGFSTLFVFRWLHRKNPSEQVKKAFLVAFSVWFSLFIAEVFFTISGINKTYLEHIDGTYMSPYNSSRENYYHVWWTGDNEHWLTKPEFSFWRPTNSLGFGDSEWSATKRRGERRILALGDSFTEGDGTAFDSSYVAFLQRELKASGDSFYIMNGGTCGSDLFYNYVNLKDRLLKYKPDFVIQSIHSNDTKEDIIVRGGLNRFQKDLTVKYKPAPLWEPIYAISYVCRIIFMCAGYNQQLRSYNIRPVEKKEIDDEVKNLFRQYLALCRENGIKLVVVLHPEKSELEDNKYAYDFAPILQSLKSDSQVTVIDLLPFYQTYIKQKQSKPADYFWKRDGHHNSKGYQMMANTIYQGVYPFLRDSAATSQ